MIHISGKSIKPPLKLTDKTAIRQINKEFISKDGEKCTNYNKVYEKLKAISLHKPKAEENESEKCFYCESKDEQVGKLQIEHYRPKAGLNKIDNNHIASEGYYWLANEWTNLLLACSACNVSKATRFPIAGSRATAFNPVKNDKLYRKHCIATNSPLKDELPLLLNPEIDLPKNYLTFEIDGLIKEIPDANRRGKNTIDILQLNRGTLRKVRYELLQDFINQLNVIKGVYDIGGLTDNVLNQFLIASCKKTKKRIEPQMELSLWGRYINNNFIDCIANKYNKPFRTKLIEIYNSI